MQLCLWSRRQASWSHVSHTVWATGTWPSEVYNEIQKILHLSPIILWNRQYGMKSILCLVGWVFEAAIGGIMQIHIQPVASDGICVTLRIYTTWWFLVGPPIRRICSHLNILYLTEHNPCVRFIFVTVYVVWFVVADDLWPGNRSNWGYEYHWLYTIILTPHNHVMLFP